MTNDEHTAARQRRADRRLSGPVLVNGGEVFLTDRDDCEVYDRIEYMPNGHVRCINKQGYTQRIYPPHKIDHVATHTSNLEDREWW